MDPREKRLRDQVERTAAHPGISPEFSLLNVDEAKYLFELLDGARSAVTDFAALRSAVQKVRRALYEPGPNLVEMTEEEQKAWDHA